MVIRAEELCLFQGELHGERHVGSGITIRNWEDIHGIDIGDAFFQPNGSRGKHVPESLTTVESVFISALPSGPMIVLSLMQIQKTGKFL